MKRTVKINHGKNLNGKSHDMKNTLKYTLIIPSLLILAMLLSACDRQGPAERAGEKIDEVTEDIRDSGEDLGNQIEDACEELKEGMDAEDQDC